MGLEDGKKRFLDAVAALSQAFAVAMPHEKALAVREEVAFLQAVKARLAKFAAQGSGAAADEGLETAVRQLIDQAMTSEQVVDIFDAAGIRKPDISILSEEFLLELLEKNVQRYHRKIVTAAEVIEELISIAQEIRQMDKEAAETGLTDFEYAFYAAVASNKSAAELMQKERLRELAVVLTEKVRANASIDWTARESVRAAMRRDVKRTLRKYGYPPDMQELATETVLKQAELIAEELAAAA